MLKMHTLPPLLNCLRKTESFAQISVAVMASCKNQDKKTYQQKLPNKHLG